MDKNRYNVILHPGSNESEFLATDAAGMTVHDNLNLFDMMICLSLTEEEATQLEASETVMVIEMEPKPVEDSYPTSTPRYESGTVEYQTRYSISGNGADHTGTNMYLTSEFEGQSNFSPPIGFFGDYQFNDTVKTNFAGDYVDIVAIEAGDPSALYAGHEDHVDFEEFDSSDSKFVPMDWSTVNGSASSARNNQVTNDNTNWYSAHAIGVLSAAGGKYCGWGKKSTLRVMYLEDGTSTAYYTVLQWHNTKAVNPVTGVRNATVVTGAWGYSSRDHKELYPIEHINQIQSYDVNGNLTTTDRPGPTNLPVQTFNYTASATGSSDYSMAGGDRVGNLAFPQPDPAISLVVGDTLNITNNANGGHPMFIKTSATTGTGEQASGVTGNGTVNISWTPSIAGTYYYICQFHGSMVGTITVVDQIPDGWENDFTPFTNALFIPRVVLDPADSTDKWCISIPSFTRLTFFDTIMSQYNNYNGIYHFKSAGNNAHVGVGVDDDRWNSAIRVDAGSGFILNTLDGSGRNQLTASTQSGPQIEYPLRTGINGGANQFTIAACQHDETNRLMDDYSSRGPQCDFASYGAYTWTSYPTSTLNDGKWGYFSGTSCAAPVAAGCATVFLDHYFTQRGVFPSISQLKELMVNSAKENLIGEEGVDFSNTPTAANISSTKLYSSTEVYRIKDNDFQNGGADLTDLHGTPALRVHIPWGVRMGSGKYIAGGSEQTSYKRRQTTGTVWPRRKVSFSS